MVAGKGAQAASADRRLRDLGIQLPAVPTPFGSYVETVKTGNLLFLSGMLPVVDHKPVYVGRLAGDLAVETGRSAAYIAALGALAAAKGHLGTLDKITRIVRLGVFIATLDESINQPKIADAASDFFKEVFGIDKLAVRSVIGVASLPLNVPIVIEVTFEIAI